MTPAGTILIADPDPHTLNLVENILGNGGYEVMRAASHGDALRCLENAASIVNLALLDVMLPGANGVDLAKYVQSRSPATQVVLTAHSTPEHAARLTIQNAYRIIWKPFDAESLLRMVARVLEKREQAVGQSASRA